MTEPAGGARDGREAPGVDPPAELLEAFRQGRQRALARAISMVENETPGFVQNKPPRVTSSIDWYADGKQHGYISAPYSANESAWGAVRVPITVIRNGDGPVVLLTGGNHGDEYEGPIALRKLAVELHPEEIKGTLILIPAMNPPAMMTNARCSPLDGVNMNRAFPGKRTGTVTEMMCHYISTVLLPKVEAVIDIHSGGKTLDFVPFAAMHYLDDAEQRGGGWRKLASARTRERPTSSYESAATNSCA